MHQDKLKTKPTTDEYIKGWNRIFNKSLKDKSFRKESKHPTRWQDRAGAELGGQLGHTV